MLLMFYSFLLNKNIKISVVLTNVKRLFLKVYFAQEQKLFGENQKAWLAPLSLKV